MTFEKNSLHWECIAVYWCLYDIVVYWWFLWQAFPWIFRSEIAVVSSASFFCASCVFPLSGYIMDRCGRKTNSILTMIFMAVGFLVMYISIDFYSLLVSGVIIGFGNGLSTGLIMALGGDYAPKDKRRGPFLSLFKLIYGSGQLFGPSMTRKPIAMKIIVRMLFALRPHRSII